MIQLFANQQGGDIGTQYRSAIFYTTPEDEALAFNAAKVYGKVLAKEGLGAIVTEINDAKPHKYWLAEEYHQRYLEKNPNGYDCHSSTGVAYPSVNEDELKKKRIYTPTLHAAAGNIFSKLKKAPKGSLSGIEERFLIRSSKMKGGMFA